ncbi:MAG: hypothetical protein A2Y33_10555 [Spirochaetes bacterium GWF1_51_8]|nr:MAG: hypothetical protein A2Y33_10555 [Spirochaetes bacterium GWF1_51_8]
MKQSVWAIAALLLFSCSPYYIEGDFFFIRNKGADMPVWVRGNTFSGTYILILHGGPGDTSFQYVWMESFRELEKKYAVVYWEQRASGSAQGNCPPETLNLAQFVEDLEITTDTVEYMYHPARLVLFGHSWGGALGAAFLADTNRQAKVNGWMMADGVYDFPLTLELSRLKVIDYANLRISAAGVSENEKDMWRTALEWYSAHPVLGNSDLGTHAGWVGKMGGYFHSPDIEQAYLRLLFGDMAFFSPASLIATYMNDILVSEKFDVTGIDLTVELSNISIPALYLWGAYDGIVPAALGSNALILTGTVSSQKTLVVFNESAHSPMIEEPQKFVSNIAAFIDSLE